MKAHVPRTFRTGGIVDSEDVNANLQAISRSITRNVGQRYTYCAVTVDVTGLVNTDTAQERTIPFQGASPGGTGFSPVDVVGVEFSIYATDGATWTLSTTDENGTVLALAVATAGTTTEGYGASNVPLQLSSAARLDLVLSASAASTLIRATVTLHVRCDRQIQNGEVAPSYSPTLVDASSSTAAATINAELVLAAAARAQDQNPNNQDMRCTCIVANDLAAAQTWRLPIGEFQVAQYAVGSAIGVAARSVAIADQGGAIMTIVCTGTTAIDDDEGYFGTTLTYPSDPTDTADDLVVTLTPIGGTVSRVYLFLWWS
jgi:hypothetical protein